MSASALILVGWQYKLPQRSRDSFNACRAEAGKGPVESWWVMTLFSTKEGAERASYGGYEGNPLNEVRPVFAKAEGR
jgi:hypothetical protein